jgi:hypothetical protein
MRDGEGTVSKGQSAITIVNSRWIKIGVDVFF